MFEALKEKLYLVESRQLNENTTSKMMDAEDEDAEIMEVLGLDVTDGDAYDMIDLAAIPEDEDTIVSESTIDMIVEACEGRCDKRSKNILVQEDDDSYEDDDNDEDDYDYELDDLLNDEI